MEAVLGVALRRDVHRRHGFAGQGRGFGDAGGRDHRQDVRLTVVLVLQDREELWVVSAQALDGVGQKAGEIVVGAGNVHGVFRNRRRAGRGPRLH